MIIWDDPWEETTEEDQKRMFDFMAKWRWKSPEDVEVASVTFTKEEWEKIFGVEQ